MNQEAKNKNLSTDEMLQLLKKSKAKPLSIDDILKPKNKQPALVPKLFDKNKPVIIPILADNAISESAPKEKQNEFHMELIDKLHNELSPSPAAIKPGDMESMEEPLKEDKNQEVHYETDEISPEDNISENQDDMAETYIAPKKKVPLIEDKEEKEKKRNLEKIEIEYEPEHIIEMEKLIDSDNEEVVIEKEVEKPKKEKKLKPAEEKPSKRDRKSLNTEENRYGENIQKNSTEKNEFLLQNAGNKTTSEERIREEFPFWEGEYKKAYFHYNLAIKLTQSGQISLAIEEYKKAINLNRNFPQVYNNLGNILALYGKKEEALEFYKTGLEIDGENARLHQNLALLLYELNNLEEACIQIQKARELDSENIEILSDMGVILAKNNKIEEAIDCFLDAMKNEPDNPVLNYNMAFIYQKNRNFEKAIETYKKVIELDPYNYFSYFNLARIYMETKKWSEAVLHLKKALEINPDDPDIYCELGGIYYQQKKFKSAFYYYDKAVLLAPGNPGLRYNFALTLANMKKLSDFARELEKAQELAFKSRDKQVICLIENIMINQFS